MAGVTRARVDEIQASAQRIAKTVWPAIDNMEGDARRSVLVGLRKQLQADEIVSIDTARKHIATALRILRGQSIAPNGWGGKRE